MKRLSCRFYKSLGTCWLSKGVRKRCFLESGLTKSLTVYNFRNKVAIRSTFFSKCLKFDVDSRNGKKKNQEKFVVLKITAFESGMKKSHKPEQDTSHWQTICYETPRRFNMSLTDIFSKSCFLRVMKKYDESALKQTLQKVGTV